MARTRPAQTDHQEASHPDDSWARSREHQAAVDRALRDSEAGRVYRLSEEDLNRLIDEAEEARREGRDYRLPREWLKERDTAHRATTA